MRDPHLLFLDASHRHATRNEQDSGHRHAGFLQSLGCAGGPPRPIALTPNEEWRIPGIETGHKEAYEFGDVGCVFPRTVELVRVLRLRRSTEPGADGIDEDEVGELQPGAIVGLEHTVAIRRIERSVRRANAFGPEPQKVHQHGVGAGAAVPQEGQWPRLRRSATVQLVIREEDVPPYFAGFVQANRQPARVCGILQESAVDRYRVPSGGKLRGGRLGDPLRGSLGPRHVLGGGRSQADACQRRGRCHGDHPRDDEAVRT